MERELRFGQRRRRTHLTRYKRDDLGQNTAGTKQNGKNEEPTGGAIPEFTEDTTFQSIFHSHTILLEFLNEVLRDTLQHAKQLTNITTVPVEKCLPTYSTADDHILNDVFAQDIAGNAYIVEMQRVCQIHDLARVQYRAASAFSYVIEERNITLYNAKTPKRGAPSYDELFRAEDIPCVIHITIAEQGLPTRRCKSLFAKDDRKYTVVSSLAVYSMIYYVFIDLKRFVSTGVLQNPKTGLDYWCHFLWNAKDGNFNAESLDKYKNYPGIQEAARRLLRTPTV